MISMEVECMRRVLFKILLPAILIALWMNVTYYACVKDGQLDYFMYWLITGCPFGIKAIGGFLYPVGFDISGGLGVLALNLVLGGIVGGVVLIFKILGIGVEVIKFFIFDVFGRTLPVIDLDE